MNYKNENQSTEKRVNTHVAANLRPQRIPKEYIFLNNILSHLSGFIKQIFINL